MNAEALSDVSHVAEERAQLDGDGNAHRGLHRFDDVNVGLFDFHTGNVEIGRDGIDVALEGIGCWFQIPGAGQS